MTEHSAFISADAFPRCIIRGVSKGCSNDLMVVTYTTNMAIELSQLDTAKTKSREVQNRTPNFMRQTIIMASPP